jgi:hypothetical protein
MEAVRRLSCRTEGDGSQSEARRELRSMRHQSRYKVKIKGRTDPWIFGQV